MSNGNGGNAGGLKQQMGVGAPAQAPSYAQAQQFKAAFEQEMTALNGHLAYTAANAEPDRHNPLVFRQNPLYAAFQQALGQIDPANPAQAQGAIDNVLGNARALNAEAGQLHQETKQAKDAWDAAKPKYDEAVKHIEELEAWEDPQAATLRGLATQIQGQVDGRKWADASNTLDQLLPNLQPIYEEYLKQKAAKAEYEPKFTELQPRLGKAATNPYTTLKPQKDQLATAQAAMEASAAKKDYVQALTQLGDLTKQVDAFEKSIEELEKQKKAYEDAWAALEPKYAQATTPPEFAKLQPKLDELIKAKADIDASVQAEQFQQALQQVNDLSGKIDAYFAAVDELKQQKKAYEDAWATLEPKYGQAGTSEFKKLEPMQKALQDSKGQIDSAVQAEDFEQALKLVNDLSGKVDTYLAAADELRKQRQAYQDAWTALEPKFNEAVQSQSVKLAPKRDELNAAKKQIDDAVAAEDFEQALKLVNDLSGKVDEYKAAVEELEKQRLAYEAARQEVQTGLDELAKTKCTTVELEKIKEDMEANAQAEEYEKAMQQAQDLNGKIQAYKEELQKEHDAYQQELERVDPLMKEVSAPCFEQLKGKQDEITAAYHVMLNLGEAQDCKGGAEAGKNLEASIDAYQLEAAKLRGSLQLKYKSDMQAIDAGMKELEKDASPEKEKIKGLIDKANSLYSTGCDADMEQAVKSLDEVTGMVDKLKTDPCSKAKRSNEYVEAMATERELLADLETARKGREEARLSQLKVPAETAPFEPLEKKTAIERWEAAVKSAELKLCHQRQKIDRILAGYGCKQTSKEVCEGD
jgi:chromosome segregation ATPase